MYIPVSINSGLTSIQCVVTAPGTLSAECAVRHKGISYPSNTDITVNLHDVIELSANITGPNSFRIFLNAKTYYWYVDVPKPVKYLASLADTYKSSTTYGSVSIGNQKIPYAETDTVSDSDEILSVVDAEKNSIWVFGLNGGVKKITLPEKPVSLVFAPKWSASEDTATVGYIVTESFVYPMIGNTAIDANAKIRIDANGPVVAADSDGFGVVACSAGAVIRVVAGAVSKVADVGGNSIQSTYQNDLVLGCDDGRLLLLQRNLGYATRTLYARRNSSGEVVSAISTFNLDTNHAHRVCAVDMTNRTLLSISLLDYTVVQKIIDDVPSSVISNKDDLYVGYYSRNGVDRFDLELNKVGSIATDSPQVVNYTNVLVTTNLYDGAPILIDESSESLYIEKIDQAIDASLVTQLPVSWPRPMFLSAVNAGRVTLNGVPFSSGYVAFPDILEISAETDGTYYTSDQINLLGARPVSVYYRTEPKLFPDEVYLGTIHDAFIRYNYEREFLVTGITSGFAAEIKADIPELTFSVNGGSFGSVGTISNGDTVVVRTYLRSLVTSRDHHNIVTTSGKLVSQLTILAMQLNGSSVMEEENRESSRFNSLIEESDSSVALEETNPFTQTESTYSTNASTGAYSVSYQTMATGDIACDVSVAGNISLHGCTFEGFTHVDCVSSLGEVGVQESQLTCEFDSNYSVADAGSIPYFGPAYYKASDAEYSASSMVYFWQNTGTELEQATPFNVTTPYSNIEVKLTANRETQGTLLELESSALVVASAYSYFKILVDRNVVHDPIEVHGYCTVLRTTGSPTIYAEALSIGTGDTHEVGYAVLFEQNTTSRILPESTVELLGCSTASECETFWSQTYSSKYSVQETFADIRRVRSDVENVLLVGVVSDSMMEVPCPIVGHFSVADHRIDGPTVGFPTEEQAEEYALSMNLEGVTLLQYEGTWIFVSEPTADNAACFPTTAPSSLQRRFGYAGGG